MRSVQALQLVQSQDLFDQREHQHRSTTQVQALHLTQQQELRAHHLEMKRAAKLAMLVKMFQVKEAERGQASVIKTEKLLVAQSVEARQLLSAQRDACDSRNAARLLDEKHTRIAIKMAAERASSVDGLEAAQKEFNGIRRDSDDGSLVGGDADLGHEISSISAQMLLSAAMQLAAELEAAQDKERKVEEEKQRDDEKHNLLKRKAEVAAEIEREKNMAAIAKRQMEADLAEMVRKALFALFFFWKFGLC